MEHMVPTVTEQYLQELQAAYAASQQHLDDHPDLKEASQRLENFSVLSVLPCVPPKKNGCPQPDSGNRSNWPLHAFEDDLQHALFYSKAGLYSDAKSRLRRFLQHSLWLAASADGVLLSRTCQEVESVAVLMAIPGFLALDQALSFRERLDHWITVIDEPEAQTAVSCIRFYPKIFRKLIQRVHEAIDLSITCLAYRKPQVMVRLEGVEKFGDYTLWADLLEPDQVDAVHAVLKPKTREWLIAYAQVLTYRCST
jgi:hypothetical protein